MLNTTIVREILKTFFLNLSINETELNNPFITYFIPIQSRDRRLTLKEAPVDSKRIVHAFWDLQIPFDWKNRSLEENIDLIELLKIKIALQIRLESNSSFSPKKESMDFLSAGKRVLGLFETFPIQFLGNFVQRYVLSEIKGALNELSRNYFIQRSVIQVVGADKKLPLVFLPKDTSRTLDIPNRKGWGFIEYDKCKGGIQKVFQNTSKEFSRTSKKFSTICVNTDDIFNIRTSRYQLQFLDNMLPDITNRTLWGRMVLKLSEPSIIVEDLVKVTWDQTTWTPQFQIEKTRLFVNVPIAIQPQSTVEMGTPTRYLGIDVGEFGLAYTLFKTNNADKIRILKQGFLFNTSLRNIKYEIQKNKNRQIVGTFSMPNSAIQKTRENAITSLRNKVHDMVVRYKAKVIYEASISNFETGSGKITKIYNSVKEADVFGSNGAEQSSHDLLWGQRSRYIGKDVSAYATSGICSKCFQTHYQLFTPDFHENMLITKVGDQKYRLTNNGISISAFAKTEPENYDDWKKAIYAAMRPPVANETGLSAEFKEHRGNSALFICPFCGHIADADVQASLFIGLKGYFRDLDGYDSKKYSTEEQRFNYRNSELSKVIELAKKRLLGPVPINDLWR